MTAPRFAAMVEAAARALRQNNMDELLLPASPWEGISGEHRGAASR